MKLAKIEAWESSSSTADETKAELLSLKDGTIKDRCIDAACAAVPANVNKILFRKSLTGKAFMKRGLMVCPKPLTRKSLYIFLHECAHFALHAGNRKPRHQEEVEAEKWAHQRMREAGIAVPRSMTSRAKRYVRRKIAQARKHGAKAISAEARRFAR